MRRLALLLALAAAPVLSGCTLAFGIASVGRHQSTSLARERTVTDRADLRGGEPVRVEWVGGPPVVGRWVLPDSADHDTLAVSLLVQEQPVTLSGDQVVRLTRWPARPRPALWVLTGLTLDVAVVAGLVYVFAEPFKYFGSAPE